MSKIVSASEAASHISDKSTVSISAASGLGCPDKVIEAIALRFKNENKPRDLTTIHPLAAGDMYGIYGINHLAQPGLLKKIIVGSLPSGPSSMEEPPIWRMIRGNQISAYNVPAGTLYDMHRDSARTGLGTITGVGLGTFADPRQQGCKMNEAASNEDIVSVIDFQNQEWLYYHPIAPTVAIIRGTTADAQGNISMEKEGALLGARDQAVCVRNNGGIVIAQVSRITEPGSRRPQEIHIPGHLVDYVVVDPDQMQTTQTQFDPSISGQVKKPITDVGAVEWGIDKVIARRVSMEIRPNEVVNVGFGASSNVPRILLEAGKADEVTWITEQGATGGIPMTGFQFGCAMNPEAIMPWSSQWAILQGGGCDRSLLSFLEVDQEANINVTHLAACPHVTAGAGGFLDITTGTPNLVFSGRFDVVGSVVEVENGGISVKHNGKIVKLVKQVNHISFSGKMGQKRKQNVTLVTERCVLRLGDNGWKLTEIAPGIDLHEDILSRIPFDIEVPEAVPLMDASIFIPDTFTPF